MQPQYPKANVLMDSTKEPSGDSSYNPRTSGRYVSKSVWHMMKEDTSGNNELSGGLVFAQSIKDSTGKWSLITPYMLHPVVVEFSWSIFESINLKDEKYAKFREVRSMSSSTPRSSRS